MGPGRASRVEPGAGLGLRPAATALHLAAARRERGAGHAGAELRCRQTCIDGAGLCRHVCRGAADFAGAHGGAGGPQPVVPARLHVGSPARHDTHRVAQHHGVYQLVAAAAPNPPALALGICGAGRCHGRGHAGQVQLPADWRCRIAGGLVLAHPASRLVFARLVAGALGGCCAGGAACAVGLGQLAGRQRSHAGQNAAGRRSCRLARLAGWRRRCAGPGDWHGAVPGVAAELGLRPPLAACANRFANTC